MSNLFLSIKIIAGILCLWIFSSFVPPTVEEAFSLEVKVSGLRNSHGQVVFALYNKQDAIPDKEFNSYFRKELGEIYNGTSAVVFDNLIPGDYAVSILHDENRDEKIKKGFFLPKEGIGFSNFKSIDPTNKPSFDKASINIKGDTSVQVSILYFN
jgi:uncharacterized protein (DUF2141 family)